MTQLYIETPMQSILMFLKFGEEKHIKDLYHNGSIYISPIQYFRQREDEPFRSDIYEGASNIKNYPKGKFTIPSIDFEGEYQSLHIKAAYNEVLGNIFSMYCISPNGWNNPLDFKIDSRLKEFGDYCIMIKDGQEFLSLVANKLNELKVKFKYGFVEYYDKNEIQRSITLFEKPREFEYQKEFRIHVERDSTDSFMINIGSLSDIAELHPSNYLIEGLKIQPE